MWFVSQDCLSGIVFIHLCIGNILRGGRMCCCCFPGFCSECCRLIRFACCTRFKRIETNESVVFTAHVLGLTVEDIQVQVESGNFLRVTGNRTNSRVESKGSSTRTETSSGQFVQVYKLPDNILAEEVRVEVDEDGFVTITVPKAKFETESG